MLLREAECSIGVDIIGYNAAITACGNGHVWERSMDFLEQIRNLYWPAIRKKVILAQKLEVSKQKGISGSTVRVLFSNSLRNSFGRAHKVPTAQS